MNGINSWSDFNWYAAGSLLAQFAFLAAGVWFARNFLRTIRAFQEQVGTLLKLSITAAPPEGLSPTANTKRSFAETSPYWLAPTETQTAREPEFTQSGPGPLVGVWRGLVRWLNAPMHTAQTSPWRRLTHWLQAPAGS
jgi:hypothetical protein